MLDKPVVGITPATLASAGYLDAFAQPMSYPLIRRFTTSPGQKLTPAGAADERQPE